MATAIADVRSLYRFTLSSSVLVSGKVRNRKASHPAFTMRNVGRNAPFFAGLSSTDEKNPVELDVRFPRDYSELLEQVKSATEVAFKDNKQLLEIEFPTSGLGSVPGDEEGGIEMTGSMQLIREFVDRFVAPEKSTRTRIGEASALVDLGGDDVLFILQIQVNQIFECTIFDTGIAGNLVSTKMVMRLDF